MDHAVAMTRLIALMYISRIRAAIEADAKRPQRIITVRAWFLRQQPLTLEATACDDSIFKFTWPFWGILAFWPTRLYHLGSHRPRQFSDINAQWRRRRSAAFLRADRRSTAPGPIGLFNTSVAI